MDPSVTRAWLTIFDLTFIETSSDGACSPLHPLVSFSLNGGVTSEVTSRHVISRTGGQPNVNKSLDSTTRYDRR